MNEIKHACNFCGQPVTLTWEKRVHKCACGVVYAYRPRLHKPGRGFAARQAAKLAGMAT